MSSMELHAEGSNPPERRSYVRKEQARVLLIDATISLFRDRPFSQVTTTDIAERAGLTPVTIQTVFGGQLSLYEATAEALVARVEADAAALGDESIGPEIVLHPDLILASRLVAWLRGEGLQSRLFASPGDDNVIIKFVSQRSGVPLDPTIERVFGQLAGYAMTGFATFADGENFAADDLLLGLRLIQVFRQFLGEHQRELRELDPRITAD